MGLRDLLVLTLIFGSLPFIVWRPYIGILVWSWISYMNPHRMSFGTAYSMPVAQIVAITLLFAIFFTRERNKVRLTPVTVLWIALLLWMTVTTFFSFFPELAQLQLEKVLKIQLVTGLTLLLINNRKKLDHLIWVIALSIGFFSTKGGVFTLMTGGGYRVYGPPDSFIYENNSLAVGTLMVVPLIFYLYRAVKPAWGKAALLLMIMLSMFSVLGSQSRGALVGIGAVGVYFWWKSSYKLASSAVLIVFAVVLVSFMPESWSDRMATITNYQEDKSAMGRINAWKYSINVANANLTGAGFESWSKETFAIYAPVPDDVHAAHSIYFSVLADHGWPGLLLFGSILVLTGLQLRRIERDATNSDRDRLLAVCLQISLVAYLAGGAFLSLAYFDLPWHIFAMTILLRDLCSRSASPSGAHSEKRGPRGRPLEQQFAGVRRSGT